MRHKNAMDRTIESLFVYRLSRSAAAHPSRWAAFSYPCWQYFEIVGGAIQRIKIE